ncbi:unnamed protein product [Dovyalis caffra]|uniref:Chromo domain-containing protein n=1 Tax=Dovyalis caffra TaxID=77055 RepID=A0AAV1SPE4_9ROSI|nr:unnamed protein product [Dovyalis caffra]
MEGFNKDKFTLERVLDRRLYKTGNQARVKWLILWKGLGMENATWEDADFDSRPFSKFHTEQEVDDCYVNEFFDMLVLGVLSRNVDCLACD